MNNFLNPELPFSSPVNYAIPADRTTDTVYQNTTGRIMLVNIVIEADHTDDAVLYVENANPPTVMQSRVFLNVAAGSYMRASLVGIVPPGWYYKADRGGTGSSAQNWIEAT